MFLTEQYNYLQGLVSQYCIPPQGTKCNWCAMVSHLYTYLKSTGYKDQCPKVLQLRELTSTQNRVCTCLCFSIFMKIVHDMKSQNKVTEDVPQHEQLNDIKLNVLRYFSGACIHHISKHMKLSVERKLLGKLHHATGLKGF